MWNESKLKSDTGERRSSQFERSWLWPVLALGGIGPLIAFLEFGIRPRTALGWFILTLGGPTVVGGYYVCDRLLNWLGRMDALGSLDSAGRRLAPAIVLGGVAVAAFVVAVEWFVGDGTSAAALKRFIAENFARGV